MDRTAVSGTAGTGSIPVGGASRSSPVFLAADSALAFAPQLAEHGGLTLSAWPRTVRSSHALLRNLQRRLCELRILADSALVAFAPQLAEHGGLTIYN